MSRVWFATELETVATWWRVYRPDGVTIAFTSHDRDLRFDDITHLSSPGMVPSAVRLSADLQPDSAEITGALDHRAITPDDLAAGRYDGARVEMGLVDWETREARILYAGSIGSVAQDGPTYAADLHSVKTVLAGHRIPQTSPTCRARFCGPGCNLSPARHSRDATIAAVHLEDNAITLANIGDAADYLDGAATFLDGAQAGMRFAIASVDGQRLVLDRLFDAATKPGDVVELREGCDHRWTTCAERFGNALNFRGEPFLPGNDHITRYPKPH